MLKRKYCRKTKMSGKNPLLKGIAKHLYPL
jgi:hypothetical protein